MNSTTNRKDQQNWKKRYEIDTLDIILMMLMTYFAFELYYSVKDWLQ